MLKKIILAVVLFCTEGINAQRSITADPSATTLTKNLFRNLQRSLPAGILFGHQDDLAYGMDWSFEPGKSCIKDAIGEYPAVYGWELGNIELDEIYNLDSVPFDKMKQFIRDGFTRGGVITLSWHTNHPFTGGNAWDTTSGGVAAINPGGAKHALYKSWLDKVAAFIADLKTEDGVAIPVIFRPFHELTGNWFWWCEHACTPEEFKTLWRFTFNYLTGTKQLHHLLFAYNPDRFQTREHYLARYPGDEYVDVMSFDMYQYGDPASSDQFEKGMNQRLEIITQLSKEKNKIPAIAETGYLNIPYSKWFTEKLMKGIGQHQISYILIWRDGGLITGTNGNKFAPSQDHFIPIGSDPAFWDFQSLYKSGKFLFEKKVAALNLYR